MLKNMIANDDVNRVVLNRPIVSVFNQSEFVNIRVLLSSLVDIDADHASHFSSQDTQLLAKRYQVSGGAGPAPTAKIKNPRMGV